MSNFPMHGLMAVYFLQSVLRDALELSMGRWLGSSGVVRSYLPSADETDNSGQAKRAGGCLLASAFLAQRDTLLASPHYPATLRHH